MKLNTLFVPSAIAIALAGLIGVAFAAEPDLHSTEIKLIGKDKKIESLKFEGELPIGESRGLYTDAGTPVTVQRTDRGLRIETPERTLDVPYPGAAALATTGDEEVVIDGVRTRKRVIILHDDKHAAEHQAMHGGAHSPMHQKHVIVVKDGDAGAIDVDVKLEKLSDLDELEAMGDLTIDGAGSDQQVVVIRKIDKQTIETK